MKSFVSPRILLLRYARGVTSSFFPRDGTSGDKSEDRRVPSSFAKATEDKVVKKRL
ncbi:hypothetical protein JW926_15835 [Candidatus Sumerlaeota bacterium]|nr:hypothetical protein [Candidatus Sumerlaeota bacterium]